MMIQDLALVSRSVNCLLRKLERDILEEMEQRFSDSLDTPITPSHEASEATSVTSLTDPSGWVDVVDLMKGEPSISSPGPPVSRRGRGSIVDGGTLLPMLSRLNPWVEYLMVGVQELVGYQVQERLRRERQPPLDPRDDED